MNHNLSACTATAAALTAPGKELVAADESFGTIGKRFVPFGIPSTANTRRAYRDLLVSTEGTVLDINQIEAGLVRTELFEFHVGGLLDRMQDEFSYHAQVRGLGLEVMPCSASACRTCWRAEARRCTIRATPGRGRRGSIAGLTARERGIMAMVLAGQPSKNIAADLGINQRTVENHRIAIMHKTGTRSLPALARLAPVAEGSALA